MAAIKKKQPYAIIGEFRDVKWRLPGYVVSNGKGEHLIHRSRKNKLITTCNCKTGQHGGCCTAMAAYMAWANKAANAKIAADEAKAAQARSEAVTIRNDTGPRWLR